MRSAANTYSQWWKRTNRRCLSEGMRLVFGMHVTISICYSLISALLRSSPPKISMGSTIPVGLGVQPNSSSRVAPTVCFAGVQLVAEASVPLNHFASATAAAQPTSVVTFSAETIVYLAYVTAAARGSDEKRKIHPKRITRTVVRIRALSGCPSRGWTLAKCFENGSPPSLAKA